MPRYLVTVADEEGTVLASCRIDSPSPAGAITQMAEFSSSGVGNTFDDQLEWHRDVVKALEGYSAEAITMALCDPYVTMPGASTQAIDIEYDPVSRTPYSASARNYSADGGCSHVLGFWREDQVEEMATFLKALIDNYVERNMP